MVYQIGLIYVLIILRNKQNLDVFCAYKHTSFFVNIFANTLHIYIYIYVYICIAPPIVFCIIASAGHVHGDMDLDISCQMREETHGNIFVFFLKTFALVHQAEILLRNVQFDGNQGLGFVDRVCSQNLEPSLHIAKIFDNDPTPVIILSNK